MINGCIASKMQIFGGISLNSVEGTCWFFGLYLFKQISCVWIMCFFYTSPAILWIHKNVLVFSLGCFIPVKSIDFAWNGIFSVHASVFNDQMARESPLEFGNLIYFYLLFRSYIDFGHLVVRTSNCHKHLALILMVYVPYVYKNFHLTIFSACLHQMHTVIEINAHIFITVNLKYRTQRTTCSMKSNKMKLRFGAWHSKCVHYYLTSIKSGKCPNSSIYLYIYNVPSVRWF